MGSDMANVKNSDLKVPPLKIVLSSATSGGSDRSSSRSPSSESDSLDSNLTIISEREQNDKGNLSSRIEVKDDVTPNKQLKGPKNSSKCIQDDKLASDVSGSRKPQENNGSESNSSDPTATKDHASTSSQRITRSSQRAAQQSKSENLSETNGDELIASEAQDRIVESARKAKRKKGDHQDAESDVNQQVPPQPIVMADICPADYQLPSHNSFELYRDIIKRPHRKLMQLNNILPKVPHGFKDYLLNNGPYLLDGNRIGVGLGGGSSVEKTELSKQKTSLPVNGVPPKMKFSNLRYKLSQAQSQDYTIAKLLDVPKVLKNGSPLYELFQDQERSRHKMRLQHLKERERSILALEQDILRAYNKDAIANSKQELNLSACTYFYYQERYHYIDEKNESMDSLGPNTKTGATPRADVDKLELASAGPTTHLSDAQGTNIYGQVNVLDAMKDQEHRSNKDSLETNPHASNDTAFLENLQEIDDKWNKIKQEMMRRHKNESDSLFAVQCLEWEWKSKEIGVCDVRVSPKIDAEFVPRVAISSIDY